MLAHLITCHVNRIAVTATLLFLKSREEINPIPSNRGPRGGGVLETRDEMSGDVTEKKLDKLENESDFQISI